MTELRSISDTYQLPTSHEASLDLAPKPQLTETEIALAEAMRYADNSHEINPDDVDARRIEIGASTIAATVGNKAATQPEVFFDPTNMEQLRACGKYVVSMREYALAA